MMECCSIRKAYLARTKNEVTWANCSSGGVFWELVNHVMARGGVCYGAKYNDDFSVSHGRAVELHEAERFRGSKYVQSDMKSCYDNILEDLKSEKIVLFSGTPCQVAAVKKYIPAKLQGNLILLEMLCHGVPSPRFFKDYINLQESIYHSKAMEVKFRGKKLKNSVQDMYIRFANGKEYKSFGTQDIYYNVFFHELISRVSCSECKFANMDRKADITLADYWGSPKKVPPELKSKIGLSSVFVNSTLGEKLWSECISKTMIAVEVPIELLDQPVLHHPISKSENRDAYWAIYNKEGLLSAFEKYFGSYKRMQFMRLIKNSMNETGILDVLHKVKDAKAYLKNILICSF